MSSSGTVAVIITACLTAAMVSTDGHAGASAYDVSPLLAERHPFAHSPPALPEVGTPQYNSQIRAPARSSGPPPAAPVVTRRAAAPRPYGGSGLASAPKQSDDPSFLTLGAGYYDFNDDQDAAEFRIEWRGRHWKWGIGPLVGVMATSDGAAYGYGGLVLDLYFGRRIVVSPSFAAGFYHDGDGKDLGSAIEFRSALEIGWRFDDRSRLSAIVYHISNAGIGDDNPGTEVLSIGYSIPLY